MKLAAYIDESALARWLRSLDHVGVFVIAMIATIGVVLAFAAGPGAAARLKIADAFHFPSRQVFFLVPAFGMMLLVSSLSPLGARRLGVVAFFATLSAMAFILLFGDDINGARRWISFGAFLFQPSEFAKSGFVIFAAWMLAEGARRPGFPGAAIAFGAYLGFLLLLIAQPDYGQAALVTAVWGVMFFIIGGAWLWIAGLIGVGAGAIALGYFFSPHIAKRIDAFFSPQSAENYQVNKALEAIAQGGGFGRGGEGAGVKYQLPDAHTDFIFAVAGEEYGFVLCAVIIALYLALVLRLCARAAQARSLFAQCAVGGLAAMIGLQAFINIAVNLRALPAKGMTLPFISYGGSSLLASGFALGLAFALARAPGRAARRKEIMP